MQFFWCGAARAAGSSIDIPENVTWTKFFGMSLANLDLPTSYMSATPCLETPLWSKSKQPITRYRLFEATLEPKFLLGVVVFLGLANLKGVAVKSLLSYTLKR